MKSAVTGVCFDGGSFSGTLERSHCQVILVSLSSQRFSPKVVIGAAVHWVADANRVCEIPSSPEMFCSDSKRHFLTLTNLSASPAENWSWKIESLPSRKDHAVALDAQLGFRKDSPSLPQPRRRYRRGFCFVSCKVTHGARIRPVGRRGS